MIGGSEDQDVINVSNAEESMGLFLLLLPLLVVAVTTSSLQANRAINNVAIISNKLASGIYKTLSTGNDNVFYSPLSISTALAMLHYGTRGKTAEEMRQALGYDSVGLTDSELHSAFQKLMETFSEDVASREYLLYVANAVLTRKDFPVLPEYANGLQNIYKATTVSVDFANQRAAVQNINNWVKQKTHNQITKLLDDIDPNAVVVLLNAVYFKGMWKRKFEHQMEGIFFNNGLESQRVKVPMMNFEDRVLYTRIEGAQVIELPYEGEDISMIVLLPNALDGLSSLEQRLESDLLSDIWKTLRKRRVIVTLPKFKMEYKKNLNSALQQLGVKNVFERDADLSGISKAGPIAVSQVLHKAVIEVNENGTEASGITGVVIVPVSANLDKHFVADHPFFFAIVDKRSGLILFQGRVTNL